MGAGKVLNVASLASLNTAINGTTAQTGYNQLNVVGDLSLTGKSLNLSGSYTPVSGNIFTIVNASNLTEHTLMWQVIIHVVFLFSALAMALVDKTMTQTLALQHQKHH